MALFEPLFAALNEGRVRYVVVGGVATVLHGHARLTADVDLVIDLEPAECRRTLEILGRLGFQPRLPVDALDFCDPARRRRWIVEKGMRVFSLVDPENPLRAVDLFAEHVLDFDELWVRSEEIPLRGISVRVASISHLIELKRLAGRPKDLEDVKRLEEIRRRREARDG
jgi:predicted nucleotidyltransferase